MPRLFPLLAVSLITTLSPLIAAYGDDVRFDVSSDALVLEYVVSVSDLDKVAAALTEAFGWKVLSEGEISRDDLSAWKLPSEATAGYRLLANRIETGGAIRLVEFRNVSRSLIRPAGRFWDTGGVFNLNFQVRDLETSLAILRRHGWSATSEPSIYEYPGGVRGQDILAKGPDDLVLSFQERFSPPLAGWPAFDVASHVDISYQFIHDHEQWLAFYSEVLGYDVESVTTRVTEDPVGPNQYGLPHNSVGFHDQHQARVFISRDMRQLLGARVLFNSEGFDYSDRAHPPHLGIVIIRLRTNELESAVRRAAAVGIEPVVEHRPVFMPPYEHASSVVFRSPGGSGAWVELVELVEPLE